MVINWIGDLKETIWEIIEGTPEIMDIVDSKILKRPVLMDDVHPGQAPYLAGWMESPERSWWAAQADRFLINMMFFSIQMSNDREDFSSIERLYIALLEALRTNLIQPDGSLRAQGRVILFSVESSTMGYFEDIQTEEGASYLEVILQFQVQNPNAGGTP